jgi:hypothetical protein
MMKENASILKTDIVHFRTMHILLLFLVLCKTCFGLTTSVIVPCHCDHFVFLEPLLSAYRDQTVLPDEVIVSLCEAQNVPAASILALEQTPWPFSLTILKHKQKLPPGANRNAACSCATQEIVISQDADDLPHPQRVEIIRYLFETAGIDHLLHQWISSQDKFELYDVESVGKKTVSYQIYDLVDVPYLHNGNNAFRRTLFEKVHWKPSREIQEDVLFNRIAYVFTKNRLILKLPLVMYRPELSTFDLDGTKGK